MPRRYYSHIGLTEGSINVSEAEFLTPPLTPLSEKDIPFKPKHNHDVSLTMRKKKKRYQIKNISGTLHRAYASSSGIHDAGASHDNHMKEMTAVRSLPALTDIENQVTTPETPFPLEIVSQPARTRKVRRWTLPSKSAPTRALTTLQPVMKRRSGDRRSKKLASPAMITLQRTATAGRSDRKSSLTFFPPPTFTRPRSNLLTYLVGTFTGEPDSCADKSINEFAHLLGRHSKRPSLTGGDVARSTMSITAPPVSTQVMFETDTAGSPVHTHCRRLSTKYASVRSVYEVIWDENDTPSSTLSVEAPISETPERPVDRRQSRAMDMLENQLVKSIAQSRRESLGMSLGGRRASYVPELEEQWRRVFSGMIESKFSRLANESSLRNLPRSKGGARCATLSPAFADPDVYDPFEVMGCNIEFFSPLRSRAVSNAYSPIWEPPLDDILKNLVEDSDASTPLRPNRLGSLIGSSSHVRRKSEVRPSRGHQASNILSKLARRASECQRIGFADEADEALPLLGR